VRRLLLILLLVLPGCVPMSDGACPDDDCDKCPKGGCPSQELPIPEPGDPIVDPEPEPFDQLYEYLKATCRVRGGGSGGSGCCFAIDDKYVYVLTCRHVAGRTKTFIVEFWLDGHITGEYKATVVKTLKVDAAILKIPVSAFKEGKLPNTIPIGEASPEEDTAIISIGCPGLSWQSLWEGHVKGSANMSPKYNGGRTSFTFVPPPKGGRSGSAIFQDGKIVGILWGSDGGIGYAVRCEDFRKGALSAIGSQEGSGNFFFRADWCRFCPQMNEIVVQLVQEGVDIQVIDYDENTTFAEMYEIGGLPAYVNRLGETLSGVQPIDRLREFYGRE